MASDVLEVSGRKMIEALIAGEKDVTVLAELAQKKLRDKIPQLQRALTGELTGLHHFIFRPLLELSAFAKRDIPQRACGSGALAPVSCPVEQLDAVAESASAG